MATPTLDQLAETIGTLSMVFPKFVTQEISRLTDQFTSSVKSISNPLASSGSLNLSSLLQEMASLNSGSVSGSLSQMSPSMLNNAVSGEMNGLIPGQLPSPTGNRITDVLNLSGTVAGNAMIMLAVLPESPYIATQMICETVITLTTLKLRNLRCLKKHTVQLANVISILIDKRETATSDFYQDLSASWAKLQTAIQEFGRSRVSTVNGVVFDVNAFDRGRTAVDQVIDILAPIVNDPNTSILAATSVLTGNTPLPADLRTVENAKLALHVAPQLASMIRSEIAAVQEQTTVINHHLLALSAVMSSYNSSGAAQTLRQIRLQTIGTIILRLKDVQGRVARAMSVRKTAQMSAELLTWNAKLQAVKAVAAKIRDEKFPEGSSLGTDHALQLSTAYSDLITRIQAIDSAHVVDGVEDVRDLVRKCFGVAVQGVSILARLDDIHGVTESDLRSFQLLVNQAASDSTGRIDESSAQTQLLQDACLAMLGVEIPTRATFEKISQSLDQLGMDRGRDLLRVGDFTSFLSLDIDAMSYLGTAIAALTKAMNNITDAGLQRQLGTIVDNLMGQRTNNLLTASDNLEFAGLRRTQMIKDQIASLQRSAESVKMILSYVQSLADKLGGVGSLLDSSMFPEMLTDTTHLAIGGGGRLSGDVWQLAQGNTAPVC